jgi:murein DD-endopeptidase MepM/ murein hydrolase activator NlpD
MKAKFKRFIRRTQVFLKSNALALLICTTVVLTIGVVALSAYFSLKRADTNPVLPNDDIQVNTPVSSSDPIVFVAPLDDVNISKDYTDKQLQEDKTTGIWQTHQAIDFSASENASVKAVYSGEIENVENSMMDGTIITLKVSDTLKVVYKSLGEQSLVDVGDKVQTGQEIATAGTNVTEKAEGIHVHLEVYENNKLVDPNNYFSFTNK